MSHLLKWSSMGLVVALACGAAPAAGPTTTAAGPTTASAAATAARRMIEQLYGEDIRRVQATPGRDDDLALVRQMLGGIDTAAKQPGLAEELCRQAYDVAIRHVRFDDGYDAAVAAADALGQAVPACRAAAGEMRLEAAEAYFRSPTCKNRVLVGEQIVSGQVEAARLARSGGDFDGAELHLRRASVVARLVKSPQEPKVDEALKALAAGKRIAVEIKAAEARLAGGPDERLRARLVFLLLVEMDDPNAAAGKLAGLGEPWKTYVPLAARKAAELPEAACLDLANWYVQDLAAKATPTARKVMLEHGRELYQSYLARHAAQDAPRTAATLAMKKLDAELGPAAAGEGPGPGAGPRPEPRGEDDPRDLRLVTAAAALPGVRNWTLTTREPLGPARKLAVRADRAQFVTIDIDMSIRIWDTQAGRLVGVLPATTLSLAGVAYAPNGTALAWWDRRYVRLVDLTGGKPAGVIDAGAAADIRAVAWSTDGRRLTSVGGDRVLRAWDARTQRPAGGIPMREQMNGLACSPDGRWLSIAEAGGNLLICEAQGGRVARTIAKAGVAWAMEWSPDSHSLAAGADRERIIICDALAGKIVREVKVPRRVDALAWSPDGQRLASSGPDASVTILRTKDWSAQDPIQAGPRNGSADVCALAWSGDSQRLIVLWREDSRQGQAAGVGLWDVASAQPVWAQNPPAPPWRWWMNWAVSEDLATVCQSVQRRGKSAAWVWQWARQPFVQVIEARENLGFFSFCQPKGLLCYCQCEPEKLVLRARRPGDPNDTLAVEVPVRGGLASVSPSPDLSRLAVVRENAQAELHELPKGTLLCELEGTKGGVGCAFSPDGRLVACCAPGNQVCLFDADGKPLRTWKAFLHPPTGLAWSADGGTIFTCEEREGELIRAWSVRAGTPADSWPGGPHVSRGLSASPEGLWLAFEDAPAEASFRVGATWVVNTKDPRRRCELRGQPMAGGQTAWKAGGKALVTGSGGWVRVWDASTFPPRPWLTYLPVGQAGGLCVNANGHFLAAGAVEAEKDLVYVVETAQAVETLKPSEFAARYGWKNDPAKARPTGGKPPAAQTQPTQPARTTQPAQE